MKTFIILAIAVVGCFAAPKPEAIPEPEPHVTILRTSDLFGHPHDPIYRHHLLDPYYGYKSFQFTFPPRSVHYPYLHYPFHPLPTIPEPYFEPAAERYVYPGESIDHEDKESETEDVEKEE